MVTISDERKPNVRHLTIDANSAGQRIDNFLHRHLKGVPRERIYRGLRVGEVRVNKGRVKASYRLALGDQVRVPPIRTAEPDRPLAAGSIPKAIEAAITYEDEDLIMIDKPARLAVHGGSGQNYGLIEGLRARRPDDPYLELVHRLDRDTSGCLLVAKRRRVLVALHDLIRRNQLVKRYLLLVRGQWCGGRKTVSVALKKNTLRSGERIVRTDPCGKPSTTFLKPLDVGSNVSLLEARLVTGRTHQIRVHAASLGHPIAGDEKYGEKDFNRECRAWGLDRMFLHATNVAFSLGGKRYDLSAAMPPTLIQVLGAAGLTLDR